MDLSAINLDFPSILIHILNILFYAAIAAVVCVFIARHLKKQRSKA